MLEGQRAFASDPRLCQARGRGSGTAWPVASERNAAKMTSRLARPSRPEEMGFSPVRTQRTKCAKGPPSWLAVGTSGRYVAPETLPGGAWVFNKMEGGVANSTEMGLVRSTPTLRLPASP